MKQQFKLRRSDLEQWLPQAGWARFGVAKLDTPLSLEFYDEWLRHGYHGEMQYLVRHRDAKASPRIWAPFAHSAIVLSIDYGKSNYVTQEARPTSARTAMYTHFSSDFADYHDKIKSDLQPLLAMLKERYRDHEFRLALDTAPVLERDLARRAGLGWVGKNTCLIDQKAGSLFFIAEILTSLETDEAGIQSDHCGTCTRCIDACPTAALIAPRKLDATRCISYWTIESKNIAPAELRPAFGDWFFGCDICQTVCPWNQKVFGKAEMMRATRPDSNREQLIQDLRSILNSSNAQLEKRFAETALARARGFGLKRNALIVIANSKLTELRVEVEAMLLHDRLSDLAQWTLSELNQE